MVGRGYKREKGQCKGDEKRRRKREQRETENQKHGQGKRWSECLENVPHAEFVMDYYCTEHSLCSRQTLNRM